MKVTGLTHTLYQGKHVVVSDSGKFYLLPPDLYTFSYKPQAVKKEVLDEAEPFPAEGYLAFILAMIPSTEKIMEYVLRREWFTPELFDKKQFAAWLQKELS